LKISLDATGVGTKMFDRWLGHRPDESRDFVKFHAAIDDRGAAHAIAITDGTTSDTLLLPYLLNDVDARMGVVRADAGYLSKDNVQCIEDLGAIPFIKPKSCSKMLSCGRPAWRHMMFRYRKDQEAFHREYNQQRRAEAFFSKFKRRFGPVKSRIGTMRRREVWMRSIILNILVVVSEEMIDELAAAG
jgi:transposase